MTYELPVQLRRFEGPYAILQNSDPLLGEFRWPIQRLPEGISIGSNFTLKLSDPRLAKDEEFEHKRRLLEQLVNGGV